MIPLAIPNLSGHEAKYLQECVTTTFVSSVGPFVTRLETMTATLSGAAAGGVAVSAGTTGLHAALTALGVGAGDLVILPSYTFIASANAIAQCGAIPWLFDIDPESWNLDPKLLAKHLRTETSRDADGRLLHTASQRRVAAIMPVYTLGAPADMAAIMVLAKEFNLPVAADAAAALGATYLGLPIAALGADLTIFSLNGNKTVTAGGGGVVVSDNPQLLALVRHLTTTARSGEGYDHDRVGFNYRMTNLQAAVGCAQMEQLALFVAAKRRIRARYDTAFARLSNLSPFPNPTWASSACWFSGIYLARHTPEQVATLRDHLRADGIEARPFWKPMHLQPPYATAPRTPMPITDPLWPKILPLPCSTQLTESDQDLVIDAVRRHTAVLNV